MTGHLTEAATSGGFTIDEATAVIGLLITITTILGGYLLRYFLGRRANSGKVQNSAADVLWQQAQQMREMLLAEKKNTEDQLDKVAEQRDRLLDSHATQVLPTLQAVNESLGQIADGLETLLGKVDDLIDRIPERKERQRGPSARETARDSPENHRGPRGAR